MKCQHMACHQCEDADLAAMQAEVEQLRRERDEQIAEAASWRATARDKGYSAREVAKERDEARAEVERLRDAGTVLVRSLERMTAERDEAQAELKRLRAEVERLRRERDEALVESAQKALSLVAIERDEARAEVERLRNDLARCREVQRATAEGWRHEVAEVASIVGAPAHTAELAVCVRAEVERLRVEVQAAREALGLAWCSDEWSLADGIRRKTHALESMIK